MAIDPFDEFRHRPVIKNRRAGVVTPESFRTVCRFSHFLPGVEQERPARESEKNRADGAAHSRAKTRPLVLSGEPHLIMVLGITEGILKNKLAIDGAKNCIEIVRPAVPVV